MNKFSLAVSIVLASLVLVFAGCSRAADELDPEAPENHEEYKNYSIDKDGNLTIVFPTREGRYDFSFDYNNKNYTCEFMITGGKSTFGDENNYGDSSTMVFPYDQWANGINNYITTFRKGIGRYEVTLNLSVK